MFSVVISEKGGAERHEAFDRTEINVGRVQGNDLMLPKGNVSKRHARLLCRDGRFIVTDLKSTNGTYVNGRKITQATIVHEGDKIYIGDFILRIDTSSALRVAPPVGDAILDMPSEPTSQPSTGGPTVPPRPFDGAPRPSPADDAFRGAQRASEEIEPFVVPAPPRIPGPATRAMPAPPNVPAELRPPLPTTPEARPSAPILSTTARSSGGGGPTLPVVPMPAARTLPPSASVPPSMPTLPPAVALPLPITLPSTPATLPPATPTALSVKRRPTPPGGPQPSSVTPHVDSLATLALLVGRVGDEVDAAAGDSGAPLDAAMVERVGRAIDDRLASMRSAGELPADVDATALATEARLETCNLGPIGPLLADQDVTEIRVLRHDLVVPTSGSGRTLPEVGFSGEAALRRAVRRLCWRSGTPLDAGERYVERRMPDGVRMFAVMPSRPDQGVAVSLRKPQRAVLTLDDLVRSGMISRAMASLLAQCVSARANVLVTASGGAEAVPMLGALAGAGGASDRAILLQAADEVVLSPTRALTLLVGDTPEEDARATRAAARLRPDHLLVSAFAWPIVAAVFDALGEGLEGVIAVTHAPSLRLAVARIAAELAAARPGMTPESARESLASSFDVAIEVARLRDGRQRVLRIAELGSDSNGVVLKDVFTFVVERTAAGGALEGTFHPTGHVPKIAEDLAARGLAFDSTLFARHGAP